MPTTPFSAALRNPSPFPTAATATAAVTMAGTGGTATTSLPLEPSPSPSLSPSSSTYWCYECDASVIPLRLSPPLICPRCRGEFLEEMDGNHHSPPEPHPHRRRRTPLPGLLYDSDDDFPDLAPPLFDGPNPNDLDSISNRDYYDVFDRLLRHIDAAAAASAADLPRGPSPASKSSIEALPTVPITSDSVAADPQLLCAVCKDEFAVGSDAKQLPCSHIYHSDCIVPWLTQHNSCPVCRYSLPSEECSERRPSQAWRGPVAAAGASPARVRGFLEEDEARLLEHVARPNRRTFHPRQAADATSPTQMAEAVVGSVEPANSVETVSSGWHMDGASSMGGGERMEDDSEAVISLVRGGFFEPL